MNVISEGKVDLDGDSYSTLSVDFDILQNEEKKCLTYLLLQLVI
jgi:hypothetical protein